MAMARDIRKAEKADERRLRERQERAARLAAQDEQNAETVKATEEATAAAKANAPATHVERQEGYVAPGGAKAASGPTENKAAAPATTAKRK